jgi:hypothetical protein
MSGIGTKSVTATAGTQTSALNVEVINPSHTTKNQLKIIPVHGAVETLYLKVH